MIIFPKDKFWLLTNRHYILFTKNSFFLRSPVYPVYLRLLCRFSGRSAALYINRPIKALKRNKKKWHEKLQHTLSPTIVGGAVGASFESTRDIHRNQCKMIGIEGTDKYRWGKKQILWLQNFVKNLKFPKIKFLIMLFFKIFNIFISSYI